MGKKNGKTIGIFSLKGGVGKTIFTINLAGIYTTMERKVLIMDLDLTGGNIALAVNRPFEKTIYNFVDDYNNNRFHAFNEYVTHYNEFIDILPSPKDPRQASKIDSKYLEMAIEKAQYDYDVILIDTHHNLDETNLVLLDAVEEILFVMNNDPMDVKNMKNLLTIKEVKNIIRRSESQIRVDVKEGLFPPPIQTGKRKVCWIEEDVQKWMDGRIKGLPEDQIKELVSGIIENRNLNRNDIYGLDTIS